MFKDETAKNKFDKVLIDKCFEKTSCKLTSAELDFENTISDFCKERILSEDSSKVFTSPHFVLVVGCKGDSVQLFGA
jgi:hypothetical protein